MIRRYLLYFFASFIILSGLVVAIIHAYASNALMSVSRFGPLVVGGVMPSGAGASTFAPYYTIPTSTFYVNLVEDDLWCVQDSCGVEGAFIQTMGGWLQADRLGQGGWVEEVYGFDSQEKKQIKSIVVIGDRTGKIVGIYPGKKKEDIASILRLYSGLADARLLKGVDHFGLLRVGAYAPLKPGDPTGFKSGEISSYYSTRIPIRKKFYVFVFSKEILQRGYCEFYVCESPEDYPIGSYINDLGGWWSSDGTRETIHKFGLDPDEVAAGRLSLLVVTDARGIIIALHPGRSVRDVLTVLALHPEVVNMKEFFK